MQIWHQFPFVRIIVPYIAGTITAIYFQIEFTLLPAILGVLVLAYLLISWILHSKISYHSGYIQGILIHFILFGMAYQITLERTPALQTSYFGHHLPARQLLIAVNEPLSEKEKSFKVVAKTMGIYNDSGYRSVSGKIMLYFEKSDSVKNLTYGDLLIVSALPQLIEEPSNPGQFNYKSYLSHRGIYHQAYVKTGNWQSIGLNRANPLKALGISLRQKFLTILQKNHLYGKEYAVASAILLGYDDYLDADQKKQFAGAGAMHILCVSGLHVGIIYIILSSLLSFLNKRKVLRMIKVALLLLMIWFYALITGLSPSVMRAATMFSFIIIGQSMQRKTNIYNSLAASAFLLIVIDPYIITAVGFQLSYLAVLGIVTLFKPLYNLYTPKNWLVDQVWSITLVSIAATMATFPLSVYYFHQFPNLFLLTNLVAIPASMLILYSGILVLITSPVPVVSSVLAQFLVLIIKTLNLTVGWIEGLPFATSNSIYFIFAEVMLLFAIIISISAMALNRRKTSLLYLMVFMVAIVSSVTYRKYQRIKQQEAVVYDIKNHSAMGLLHGSNQVLLADSAAFENPRTFDFNIRPHLIIAGVRQPQIVDISSGEFKNAQVFKKGPFICAAGCKFLHVNSSFTLPQQLPELKIAVDYIIIGGNPKIAIKAINQQFTFKGIIFDSSNAPWNTKKWKSECEELGVMWYDVSDSGAWTIKNKKG